MSIDSTKNAFGEGIRWLDNVQDTDGVVSVDKHDIGWAVEKMRQGFSVYREGWNGKGQLLRLKTPVPDGEATLPYVYICTVQGYIVPWLCSQTDLLATDWEIDA